MIVKFIRSLQKTETECANLSMYASIVKKDQLKTYNEAEYQERIQRLSALFREEKEKQNKEKERRKEARKKRTLNKKIGVGPGT